MAFQAEEMLQYLNYAAIGVIGLAAFWGFIQGFYKSTFFLIWTVGVLVLAYFMMPLVSNFLMTLDLSMVEQYFTLDVPITNLKETIPALLINMQPSLENVLVEGSDALALLYGAVQMVVQLVFLIVVLVLNATVFKVVGWILWLIFKPKGKKKKKTGLSRLLGTGVGALRGAFSVLLMAIPIAGLVAFSGALDLAMSQQADASPTYQLMLIDDELVLVEVQQSMSEQDEMIEEVQLFLSQYRTTYVGMIAGYVKIDDVALDEYVFDSIFEVKVKTESLDTSIKFRAELQKALEAVNLLVEANDGSTTFDDTIIYKLSPEDVTAIMDLVSNLDLIEVIIPVGLEYLLNSGEFDEMLEGYEDLFVLEDLKAINYMQDLGILGDVFADALTLIQAQSDVPLSDINYFIFDGETVTDIFANIGQLEMLQYGLPLGLNYALGMPDIEAMLQEQGVDKADLTLPTGEDLQSDFEAIANLYLAIQGLGFESMDDFETLQDPEVFGAITDQTIADIFEALFAFNLINDNTGVVAGIIYDQLISNLPADYQGLITEADISANFNATEITNLVLLAKVVVSTGIITLLEEENPDYSVVLSDENIDAIVSRISGSNLISSKMNDVIASLLSQLNLGVTLVIPPTINWGSQSGETELTNLLKAAREILLANIMTGDLTALTNESIDDLSEYLAASYVIRYNLNAIFEMVSSEAELGDFEIVLPEAVEEWTELEINSLLKAAKILMTAGSTPEALLGLAEADIHTLALSKVISNTFEAVFTDMVAPGGDLDGILSIPADLTWYSTGTKVGELEYLLLALKEIVPPDTELSTFTVDLNTIISADIEVLLASKVIEHTAVLTVQPMIESGSLTNYIEPKLPGDIDYVWYQGVDEDNPDGDLKPLLLSIQTLDSVGISLTTFDYNAFSTVLSVEANIQIVNDAMLDSRILHNSLDKMFTFVLNDNANVNIQLNNQAKPTFWQGDINNDGELIKLLRGISKLGTGTMDANLLLNLSNSDIHTISLSEVISMVFKNVFTDMVEPTGSNPGLLEVPTGLTWHSTDTTTGELEHLLIGLKLLVPGGDIGAAVIDVDSVLSLDLDTLVLSKVIEATLVEKVKPVIETGALATFINPTLPNAEPYKWKVDEDVTYPQGDLLPLLKAIRDMQALGIDYNNFNYASMAAAINDDAKAETLSDILLSSRVFEFSLDKMFNQILITQGGLNISPIDSSSNPDFWRGDINNDGELVLLLKAINAADFFQATDLTTIDGSNSSDLKAALNKINNSSILRPILGEIMDSNALNSASSWKVTPQPTLTKQEWSEEIDVLVDLLVELNGGFSLSSIDIANMSDTEADDLGVVLKLVAQSRLLDIEVISTFMKSGIESAFGTTLSTPLGEVVDQPYATKVAAWNTPTTGEVDRLVDVIKGLSDIQPISSLNPIGDNQGDYTDADLLGGFFNTMKQSVILGPIVPELVLVVTPDAVEDKLGPIDSNTDYQVLLRQLSDDVWYEIMNP